LGAIFLVLLLSQKFGEIFKNEGKMKNRESLRFIGKYRVTKIPYDYERAPVTLEQSMFMQKLVLEIFTTCANMGLSLQEILVSIYISGLEHGAKTMKQLKGN